MTRLKHTLLAAAASTVCAAVWLANCVLDVCWGICGSLPQDVLLSCVWSACAVLWWLRWRQERRVVG
ncbi:MAG: hypothetical protein IJ343_10980 [Clostridia bacterium]|nr:hypothetical protein [Clostridia bacterium]